MSLLLDFEISEIKTPAGSLYQSASEIYGILRGKRESKPPVPKRCSSLERPNQANESNNSSVMEPPPPRTKSGKIFSKDHRKDSEASMKAVPTLPDFNQAPADMSKKAILLDSYALSLHPLFA